VCVYNVNIIAVLNYETDVDLKFGAENVHKINKYQVITLTDSLLLLIFAILAPIKSTQEF